MKTQSHNQGELTELKVKIEAQLVKDLQLMAENAEISIDEIVAVSIKRFKSSHADYMGVRVDFP
ncbi:MAG: hypothetical protein HON90_12650 [Halobacteriovoraceae bacterium]|jgi:hypothetical protein|nr:hypothetical protein [Halobacteriovoraceae bacterium]